MIFDASSIESESVFGPFSRYSRAINKKKER